MKLHLLLRKKFEKLVNDPRGFSSVIGTVFMVIVVLLLSTNVFLWTLSQNTLYNQAVKEKNQMELDRLNERVVAFNVNYTVSEVNKVRVEVTVTNDGPFPVEIITLWVLDITIRKYGFNDALNLNLNPGDTLNLFGADAIIVTIEGAETLHYFSSWFVTARGNTVPLEREKGIIVAQLAQGIGSMAIDFYTFRYFTYNGSRQLANYPEGNYNFTVPYGTDIAFGVYLTNLDPLKQTITLNKFSQLWIYFPKSPGTNPQWYIVNVASNGIISSTYSEVPLNYGETKFIIFASSAEGTFSPQSIGAQVRGLPCAVNLLLLGRRETKDYGQNIPFVSLYVNP